MRITYIKVWKENLELSRPYTIAYRTVTAVENFFVYLQLDNGHYGIGAGSPSKLVTGEDLDHSLDLLRGLLPDELVGRNILEINQLLASLRVELGENPAALAAVDTALHDAFAKQLGIRLCDWFGMSYSNLPTSITIGIKEIEETVEEALEHVQAGFRSLKIKTGLDLDRDVEVCQRLREHLPPVVTIRVDANQGYDLSMLETFFRKTDGMNIEFVEQPLPAGEYETLLSLPERYRLLCVGDEDLHTVADAIRLAQEPRPYGIFNIKLMKCGGLLEARRIADIAERANLELMWGCNDESIISITAALSVALSCPATSYLDLDGSFDLARDVVEGGFQQREGALYPAEGPGLGVALLQPIQ